MRYNALAVQLLQGLFAERACFARLVRAGHLLITNLVELWTMRLLVVSAV
jgi:hypothetical protein